MMKKYLIIIAIISTFIACEKQDNHDGDHSDKVSLFLEEYDGVVWVGDESTADDSYYLSFYHNPGSFNYWEVDLDSSYCFPTFFGQVNDDGDTISIIEENESTLLLSVRSDDGTTSNVKITALDNGSNLKTELIESNGDRETEYFTRSTSLDPCK